MSGEQPNFNDSQVDISYDVFAAVDMRVGTVLSLEANSKARKPAYVLTIDFGPLGIRTTSVQITEYYDESLVGQQVVAAVNLGARNIAGVRSEVLVLGPCETGKPVVLLQPERPVPNGTRIA